MLALHCVLYLRCGMQALLLFGGNANILSLRLYVATPGGTYNVSLIYSILVVVRMECCCFRATLFTTTAVTFSLSSASDVSVRF